jgi:hypothetical protein
MSSSLPFDFSYRLLIVCLIAAGSCSTRSIIGQQTGQGGATGLGGTTGAGGTTGTGGGDGGTTGTGGGEGGTTGMGGQETGGVTGAGGSNQGSGGGSCPASVGASGSGLSFAPPVDYLTYAGSFLVALGDLNGDGKPDLVVANYSSPPSMGGSGGAGGSGTGGYATGGTGTPAPSTVSVFLSSTGGYAAPQFYTLSGTGTPGSIVAGDLNGDGKADVAVTNRLGVSVFFNDGTGALLAPVSFATGNGPSWVALGDLNGDGKADLAVADAGGSVGNDDVAVLINTGGGTFVAANYPVGATPVELAMADLNGDGNADLAVANGVNVSVLLNNGNGTFGAPVSYGSGTDPFSVAAGDLNGDGKIDLVAGRSGGGASVLLNVGNGTFAAAINYNYTYNSSGPLAIGDLNGDGRPDLAGTIYGCGVTVAVNQGSGVFGAPSYLPPAYPLSVTVGDLNGDGKLDTIVPYGDGVAVLLNTTP